MRNFWILSIIFISLTMWSCNNDDDYSSFHYVARGIDSIAMPDSANIGQRIEIKTYTQIRMNCEQFQTHGYDVVGNERTVSTWFVRFDDQTCGDYANIAPSFFFLPQASGLYHFRFWAGQDEETEEDQFITKDIYIRP